MKIYTVQPTSSTFAPFSVILHSALLVSKTLQQLQLPMMSSTQLSVDAQLAGSMLMLEIQFYLHTTRFAKNSASHKESSSEVNKQSFRKAFDSKFYVSHTKGIPVSSKCVNAFEIASGGQASTPTSTDMSRTAHHVFSATSLHVR